MDLKAAFDSVESGEFLEGALERREVSKGLVSKYMDILRETKNRIRIGEKKVRCFGQIG